MKSKGKDDLLEIVESISNLVNIHYVRQKEQLGLGHAVRCAKTFVGDEPFAVLLGDDIVRTKGKSCLKQLIDVYEANQKIVLGVQKVDRSQVNKYGIVSGDNIGERLYKVDELVEKPDVDVAKSNIAILGRYILSSEIFDAIDNTKFGKGGEIQLTDALIDLAKKQDILAYDFEGERFDAGDKLGYLKATVEFALEKDEVKDEFREYLKGLTL